MKFKELEASWLFLLIFNLIASSNARAALDITVYLPALTTEITRDYLKPKNRTVGKGIGKLEQVLALTDMKDHYKAEQVKEWNEKYKNFMSGIDPSDLETLKTLNLLILHEGAGAAANRFVDIDWREYQEARAPYLKILKADPENKDAQENLKKLDELESDRTANLKKRRSVKIEGTDFKLLIPELKGYLDDKGNGSPHISILKGQIKLDTSEHPAEDQDNLSKAMESLTQDFGKNLKNAHLAPIYESTYNAFEDRLRPYFETANLMQFELRVFDQHNVLMPKTLEELIKACDSTLGCEHLYLVAIVTDEHFLPLLKDARKEAKKQLISEFTNYFQTGSAKLLKPESSKYLSVHFASDAESFIPHFTLVKLPSLNCMKASGLKCTKEDFIEIAGYLNQLNGAKLKIPVQFRNLNAMQINNIGIDGKVLDEKARKKIAKEGKDKPVRSKAGSSPDRTAPKSIGGSMMDPPPGLIVIPSTDPIKEMK